MSLAEVNGQPSTPSALVILKADRDALRHEITEQTFYAWKTQLGSLELRNRIG